MAKIAVAGASGFVGRYLMSSLLDKHELLALGRHRPTSTPRAGLRWIQTDLFSMQSTIEALSGADVAIYLVHSMTPSSRLFQGDFHDTDLLLADNFSKACAQGGVKQIIYLGGLVPEGYISAHLKSRNQVEDVLRSHGVPVTALRAGMIVGPGGSSFEILRHLVRRLPVMLLPRWTRCSTQAVFIDDVVRVIEASILKPSFFNRTIDVVNGESLNYQQLLEKMALVLERRRYFIPVPITSTGFSKLWVRVFGNSTSELVSPLIDSLLCDLPTNLPEPEIRDLIHYDSFETMTLETLRRGQPAQDIRGKLKPPPFQNSVRSIQRLPAIPLDARWLAVEYISWLAQKFRYLIKFYIQDTGVEFRLPFLSKPLLILRYEAEDFESHRQRFTIQGGWLAKPNSAGWLEFRQLCQRRFTIVALNDFIPRLPWPIYSVTQAPLHRLIMLAFGRHIEEKFRSSRQSRTEIVESIAKS